MKTKNNKSSGNAHLADMGVLSQKEKKPRRWFLNILMSVGGIPLLGSVLYPIIRYLIPPKNTEAVPNTVEAGTIGDLKQNSGKIIRYGRKPVILIHLPDGGYRAFSAICTHLGCIVQYRQDFEHIWCACHNGHYDLYGKNISGPPPRPLAPYKVNIKDGKIFVAKYMNS
ncbi:MAG TPA: Rieske (2Fe-2S) protein [Bacteroidetes bacterium]|nr:Rieske (2Fe-2S) protein [Bacteroidota bacterium]